MASPARRLPTNAAGDFFVDATCIDCATCRWMAPATFDRAGEYSRVHRQPVSDEERRRALMALVACPTASIGTASKPDLKPITAAFPDPIEEPVYHCGYHHEDSFGAASYLIVRPEGNVLVDSPRFARPLVRRIEALGGVRLMFLTHRDDVADHRKFRDHFGCQRILHRADVGSGTRDVEIQPTGRDPIPLAADLTIIPVPGHTAGSACLLFRERFLFSGDHLACSRTRGVLCAFDDACWYDWGEQIASMERLAEHRFERVLPGHGAPGRFTAERMPAELARCIAEMRAAA